MRLIVIDKLKNWTLAVLFAVFVGGSLFVTVAPMTVSAVSACEAKLLTFPTWYRGLVGPAPACELKSPAAVGGLSNFIWTIVLNVIEIGLQLVGYIAVGYILYGGFLFMTSQGSPDGAVKARKTILNAVIGLVVSMASIAVVNLAMSIKG